MPTAIDAHAHVIVAELLREAASGEPWRSAIAGDHIELDGRRITSAVQEFVDLDRILATLEDNGIGAVLLCPWVPLLFYDVNPAEGLARCRLQNRGLGRLREARPERAVLLGNATRELSDG